MTETASPASSHYDVLVVDDEAATRMLVSRWLSTAGISAVECASGEQALECVQREAGRIGVILLDVMMPSLGGFEVLQRLKAEPHSRDIPVILLTAHANEDEHVVRGIEGGAEDHLQKPFKGAVLIAKVRALCGRRRASESMAQRLVRAESLATTDSLTGLGNRRQFETQLSVERAYSARHREPFSLLLLDLDHFKSINDTYGHPEGDRVLRYASASIKETLRGSDQGFRLGGEEFGVLLRNSDRASGLLVARRLVEVIHATEFPFVAGPPRHVTTSVGVASVDARNDFFSERLVERADRALYQAKQAGRDRAIAEEA